MNTPGDVTILLGRLQEGDARAGDELLARLYAELRQLAQRYMRRERANHTLQTTGLVHEAYLKLAGSTELEWQDRNHFLAVAATAMRRVLVDHARSRKSQKRAGSHEHVPLDRVSIASPSGTPLDVLDLDAALCELESEHPRKARAVELLFFGDLTEEQAAAVMEVNARTVRRDWAFARAWLARALHAD